MGKKGELLLTVECLLQMWKERWEQEPSTHADTSQCKELSRSMTFT